MAASITTQTVIDHYSTLAKQDSRENAAHISKAAEAFGYSPEDLANIPEGANLGLSCGNPLAIAGLREVSSSFILPVTGSLRYNKNTALNSQKGEIVIDLGSGAGFDVFQAARKVGPTGLAIGIDRSTDMLE
jgi:arsenite methyltransferase